MNPTAFEEATGISANAAHAAQGSRLLTKAGSGELPNTTQTGNEDALPKTIYAAQQSLVMFKAELLRKEKRHTPIPQDPTIIVLLFSVLYILVSGGLGTLMRAGWMCIVCLCVCMFGDLCTNPLPRGTKYHAIHRAGVVFSICRLSGCEQSSCR